MFEVQSDVPMPEINRTPKGVRRKYPVEGMKRGAMFFVPGRSSKSVSAYVSRITKNLDGRFSARHCWMRKKLPHEGDVSEWTICTPDHAGATEGTGVWRIE
jgi:hypothetical protein